MRSEQPCRWARASRTYNTSSLGRLTTLRLDLLQVGVHLRITRDDSLDDLLNDAVLVLFDRLLDIGQLGLGRGVDRGLRGGFVGRVLGVSYWRKVCTTAAPFVASKTHYWIRKRGDVGVCVWQAASIWYTQSSGVPTVQKHDI